MGGGWEGQNERDAVEAWEVVWGGGRVYHVSVFMIVYVLVDNGEGRDWPAGKREAIRETGSRSPSPYSISDECD